MSNLDWTKTDLEAMGRALDMARQAQAMGEVPVGAVLISSEGLVAEAGNQKETSPCPISHAEILVIRDAASKFGRWRLDDCTLYVTLEPCLMCAGAIIQSRLKEVVFASPDPKAGAMGSLYTVGMDDRLNHQLPIRSGLMAEESRELLQSFFRHLRQSKVNAKNSMRNL